jgi:hypothetical protein
MRLPSDCGARKQAAVLLAVVIVFGVFVALRDHGFELAEPEIEHPGSASEADARFVPVYCKPPVIGFALLGA